MKQGDKVRIKAGLAGVTYTIVSETRIHNFKGTKTHRVFRLDKFPNALFRTYELEVVK